MKKRLLLCFSFAIFMLFSFVRCSQDILDVEDDLGVFTKEARLFFEQNAADIQTVRVGKQKEGLARSMALSSRVITPNWEEGQCVRRGAISSLEVPLTGDVYVKSYYSRVQDGVRQGGLSNVETKLIIQKHDELEEMRSFVVTIITDRRYEIMHAQSSQTCSFLSPKEFSGLMIVSDLEGNYLDAFQFTEGKQQRVALARASGMEEKDIDPASVSSTFTLMDANSAGIYTRSGEAGGWTPVPPGDIPEVTVTYCNICHLPIEQCRGHSTTPPVFPPVTPPVTPPVQWVCPFCGSYFCPGSCRGGSGTGGAGDIPSMNDKTSALFKKNGLGNDIADFNKLMNELVNDCAYKAIFEYLKTKAPFDKVEYDPHMGEGTQFEGASGAANNTTLKFRDKDAMTIETLRHEIYHMYQHRYFGKVNLGENRHMIEFEERIYEDISAFVHYGGNVDEVLKSGHGFYCIYPGLSKYETEYYAFLTKITIKGAKYGTLTDEEFYHWATVFGETSRTYPNSSYDYSVKYTPSINDLLRSAKQVCDK